MKQQHLEALKNFELETLPNLDVVVLGALELFGSVSLPEFHSDYFKRPIVIGSGNAAVTARILFDGRDAVFADESDFEAELNAVPDVDGAVLVSASGGKHAVAIAEVLKKHNLETWLLTNNEDAPAKRFISDERVIVYPKNREPYTYNTSTYLGMILAQTKEDPTKLYEFLESQIKPLIPDNLGSFDSFYLIVPERFHLAASLFVTKFDELFGSKVSGRSFTFGQTEHAKTVVPSGKESFISFGEKNETFGEDSSRLFIPLPEGANYGAIMAIGYYVIGHIQKQNPPYFKDNIVSYTKEASRLFNQNINPIVE